MPVSAEQFLRSVAGWDVHPVNVAGELVGAVLINGEEIHACIKPEGFGRWISKGLMKRTLIKVMAQHGRALTRVASDNETGRKFVERMGFSLKEEQNGICVYEVKHGN